MFGKKRAKHIPTGSASTIATSRNVESPLVSPLQGNFDLSAAPFARTSNDSLVRPRTADGPNRVGAMPKQSQISLQPPFLPPIPRVASHEDSLHSSFASGLFDRESISEAGKKGDNDAVSTTSLATSLKPATSFEQSLKPATSFEQSLKPATSFEQSQKPAATLEDPFDPFRPSKPRIPISLDKRPSTAGGSSGATTPRMESSLFPQREASVSPLPSNEPSITRAFIDSRDKPYNHPPPKTLLPSTSTPNLVNPQSPTSFNFSKRGPSTTSSKLSSPSLQDLPRRSATGMPRYSGSTARPSTHASSLTAHSASPTTTIGTPYGSNSAAFPLPKHVATRPKTAGVTATIAGVAVPTHHTSTVKPDAKNTEKRKTRLLNPMSLLQRRRSGVEGGVGGEDRLEREAQTQALARQKTVVASGVNKLPADFDPRIKGRVVHDFSAPRSNRNGFYETDMSPAPQQLQIANSASAFPAQDGNHARQVSFQESDNGSRRSQHTPVFMEHLNEHPEPSKRVTSLQAENLENKDFLKRASKHSFMTTYSQESAILPPFARRSQTLDPAQASLYSDDDSKRSSDPYSGRERDSNLSAVTAVSAVTARSSNPVVNHQRGSLSPISPSSPGKTFRLASEQFHSAPTQEKQHRSTSETTVRLPSLIPAPLVMRPITESSLFPSPVALTGLLPNAAGSDSHFNRPVSALTPDELWQSSVDPNRKSQARSFLKDTAGIASCELTPEPQQSENTFRFPAPSSPPKLVEKRASAVGHSRRSISTPKHRVSTGSKFSFQLGESAEEEHALEEKHRRIASKSSSATIAMPPNADEDEDEFFDEDAMDDMDEMEVQQQQHQKSAAVEPAPPSQSLWYLQQARQVLQEQDSDDESKYDEDHISTGISERDLPYADHPAFRMHSALASHSRGNSNAPGAPASHGGSMSEADWRDNTIDLYMRDSISSNRSRAQSSRSGAALNNTASPTSPSGDFVQDIFGTGGSYPGGAGAAKPRSNFYMQPQAAGYASNMASTERPPLLHRDSGNAERNRAASGMSFTLPALNTETESPHARRELSSNRGERVVSGMSYSTISDESRSPPHNSTAASHSQGPVEQASHAKRKSSSLGQHSSDASKRSRVTSGASFETALSSPEMDTPAFADSEGMNGKENGSVGNSAQAAQRATGKRRSLGSPLGLQDVGFSRMTNPTSTASKPPSTGKRHSIASTVRSAFGGAERERHRHDNSSITSSPRGSLALRTGPKQDSIDTTRTASATGGFNPFGGFSFGEPASSTKEIQANRRRSSPAVTRSTNPFIHQRIFSQASTIDGSIDEGSSPIIELGPVSEEGSQTPRCNVQQSASSPRQVHHESKDSDTLPNHPVWVDQPRAKQNAASSFGRVDNAFRLPEYGSNAVQSPQSGQDRSSYSYNNNLQYDSDDDELSRYGRALGIGPTQHHQRNVTAMSVAGADGPYPTFAMPNAAKARERDSQMLLEDLPLMGPVDPKLIPQRNPSEDAKRLGLSDKVPPLPGATDTEESRLRTRVKLENYHAALAKAANQAAVDGRFSREPSVRSSTGRKFSAVSASAYSATDAESMYSSGEEGGELALPDFDDDYDDDDDAEDDDEENISDTGRSGTTISHPAQQPTYSPPSQAGLGFDFGFDQAPTDNEGDDDLDDEMVAAANAEVLASDDDGFYGSEFQFYGRPRANSGDLDSVNGGYFGADGDDGLTRNKSLQEPNLTPITERSEFSTRNSFIGISAGSASVNAFNANSPALSRLPLSPLLGNEITSIDELKRLRASAFTGSGASQRSSNRSSMTSLLQPALSPSVNARFAPGQGYFGPASSGGSPMTYNYSTESSGSSNPPSVHPVLGAQMFQEKSSPRSVSTNGHHVPYAPLDSEATPKRAQTTHGAEPSTARKASAPVMGAMAAGTPDPAAGHRNVSAPMNGHSAASSQAAPGAEAITYVRERDPEQPNKPRWIIERRRTGEQGQLELMSRELVREGMI